MMESACRVAQIFNLLYRRPSACERADAPRVVPSSPASNVAVARRLQIGDTAD
jgi:hypothetical protein